MTHPKRSLASMTTVIWGSRLFCRRRGRDCLQQGIGQWKHANQKTWASFNVITSL